MTHPALLTLCRALEPSPAGEPPDWLLLVPPGPFTGRDGRSYINPDPAAIVAAFDPSAQLPLDWEHATHLRAPQGQDAPAAGWITELAVRDDGGVWGRVEWTDAGAEAVRSRGYRYYSPAYLLSEDRQTITRLASAGLTNQPNLRLPALNQAALIQETPSMLPRDITAPLGLPEDATVEQAAAKIAALHTSLNQAQHQAQTPDLSRFAPRADLDAALNRATVAETALQEVRAAQTKAEIDALIEQGLTSRRLTPATVDYHRAQAQSEGGITRLRDYLAQAPAILDDVSRAGQNPDAGAPSLNADERRIASAFGHTPDTLAKYGALPA